MSPTMRPFLAQLFLGDFQAVFFKGPKTATGTPRLVIVIGSARSSISSRRARHVALNSVALTTRVFMPTTHDPIQSGKMGCHEAHYAWVNANRSCGAGTAA